MRSLFTLLLLVGCIAPAAAGTWGYGQFDNDQSLDTSSNWAGSGTLESIQAALALATSAKYLDADDAVNALVAAEVVAASLGRANKDLPADLAAWVQGQPRDRLLALALKHWPRWNVCAAPMGQSFMSCGRIRTSKDGLPKWMTSPPA